MTLIAARDHQGYISASWLDDDGERQLRHCGEAGRMPLDLPARYRSVWPRAVAALHAGAERWCHDSGLGASGG